MTAESHGSSNKIYFTHTDNAHWVRMEDDEGTAGWFFLEGFDRLITPGGEAWIGEYIDGLNNVD